MHFKLKETKHSSSGTTEEFDLTATEGEIDLLIDPCRPPPYRVI
jgi:hypothetical protein